ncbi:MAG TPA: MTH1187 family thiamine-binding protein [Desulfobulbus sp.]|nr:MTH1187 family thiamine-binding protein [Desulfobulbus sp.]
MALMQITIIPVGTGSTSVGRFVADVQLLLEKEGVEYALNDMGTEIYGTPTELFALAARIHEEPFRQGAERVVTQIVIDDRRDLDRHIGDKQRAVRRRLENEER